MIKTEIYVWSLENFTQEIVYNNLMEGGNLLGDEVKGEGQLGLLAVKSGGYVTDYSFWQVTFKLCTNGRNACRILVTEVIGQGHMTKIACEAHADIG